MLRIGGEPSFPPMLHIALTGNIASGKSAVATLLAQLGATIVDADVLARAAIAPETPGYAAVVEYFSRDVISPDGTLDRTELRRRVFADPVQRGVLNAIVHPAVARLRDARVAQSLARGDRIVVSDIPLLFEVGLEHAFDGVLLVDAPDALRLERLIRDRGLSREDALAMMNAQWPSARKRAGATWVIDNDGSRDQLAARVADVWRTLNLLADQRAPGAPATP